MKKRILFTVFVLSMLLLIAAAPVYAAPEVTVILDGKTMTFDVPPQIVNDRTLVPLRAIFEGMGASIEWDGDTETVTATKGNTVVVLTIGSTSPTINGSVVTIDQPGIIVNDRTLAPLRFVAEAFGGTVAWDDNSQTASISMGDASVVPTSAPEPTPMPEPTPTPEPTQPSTNGGDSSRVVGMWRCDNSTTLQSVIFFNADGTFIMFAVRLSSGGSVEHFRGNYKIAGDTIEGTNMYRYQNDVFGERDAKIDSAFAIYDIIREGTRDEIMELQDPNHELYKQNGHVWDAWATNPSDFVFLDDDNIQFNLFGGNNKYTRVK